MRKLVLAAAALVLIGMAADVALAQPARPKAAATTRPGPAGDRLEKWLAELGLPAEKLAQVKQILQTHRQAAANWWSENGEKARQLREKVEAARKAGDEAALKAAHEEMQKLMQSLQQVWENTRKQLAEVLTDEQMQKVEQMVQGFRHAAGRILAAVKGLNLTEEQKAKVREILEQARTDAQNADSPEAKKEIWKKALEKIRDEVLTAEQRKQLEEMHKGGEGRPGASARPFADLNLTDEQKAQIAEIHKAAREKAAQAKTDEERLQIRREAHRKILEEVLTEEQRQQLKGRLANRLGRGGTAPAR